MFVIYNVDTTAIEVITRHRPFRRTTEYKTEAAAKAAMTRNNLDTSKFAIADKTFYHMLIEREVVRTNFMTGEEYRESVNTPNYCSPSSETYWSM
jgi:hypothetical protein